MKKQRKKRLIALAMSAMMILSLTQNVAYNPYANDTNFGQVVEDIASTTDALSEEATTTVESTEVTTESFTETTTGVSEKAHHTELTVWIIGMSLIAISGIAVVLVLYGRKKKFHQSRISCIQIFDIIKEGQTEMFSVCPQPIEKPI